MNAFFYKQIWHIVGDVVINVVLDFLNSRYMEPSINYTYIVLIPKIKSSKKSMITGQLVFVMSFAKLFLKNWPIDLHLISPT